MSNLIQNLEAAIRNCRVTATDQDGDLVDNAYLCAIALKELQNINPNTLKMIRISELQNKLFEIGFIPEVRSTEFNIINFDCLVYQKLKNGKMCYIEVRFTFNYIYVSQNDVRCYYNSPTFEQETINHVNALLESKNNE